MTTFRRSGIIILTVILFSCGGTKKEEIDYSQITDAEMLQLGNKELQAGNYQKAIDNYQRLLLDFPTSNLHIDAQLKIAEAYGKMDKYEQQMDQLYRLVKENIIPERVPKIYVQIGKFYERAAQFNPGIVTSDSSDYNKALKYYELALKYPDSDDAVAKSEAVYRRGLVEAKIGKIDDAISRYQLVSNLYPNSDYSILAQIKLRDPSDISELAVSDSAMTNYKLTLGLIEKPVEDDDEEEIKEPEKTEEQKTNLDKTIENLDNEKTGDPSVDESTPENPGAQQTIIPEQMQEDSTSTPAAVDTTDN